MSHRYLASAISPQHAAELFRLMIEDIKECAVFMLDPNGVIVVWNKAAEEMKGYAAEEAIGQHLSLLYTDEDKAIGWPAHNLKAAAEKGFYTEERWRKRKDGTVFWAHTALTALRNDDNELLGFSKITLDLTRHKLLEECEQERDEISLILKAAESGTWKWDTRSNMVTVSQHFFELLGYPETEHVLPYKQWIDFVHPADRETACTQLHAARDHSPQSPFEIQLRVRRRDGSYRWFHVRADWRPEPDGAPPWVLMGVCVDIHALKMAEDESECLHRQIDDEQIRFSHILNQLPSGVVLADTPSGKVSYQNHAAEKMLGRKLKDIKCLRDYDAFTFSDVNGQRIKTEDLPLARTVTNNEVSGTEELLCKQPDGTQVHFAVTTTPIFDSDGISRLAVAVMHDVTESRHLLHRLGFEASHDALTGLANRREFETRLLRTLEHVRCSPGTHAALLYMDLDQFKIVNDTCGHSAGDELLRSLAQVYREQVRERDTLARIGGDEFALIVEHSTVDEAILVAHKLLAATRNFRHACKGRLFQIGVSIGLVSLDSTADSIEQVLRQADHACYQAKESGRNRLYIHQSDDNDLALRRSDMHWVTRLSDAFANDQLQLFSQPIAPIGDGVSGGHYEILLRLKNSEGAPIRPGRFLPAAERYDVMPNVDRWVLKNTLLWLERHPKHVADLSMCSINLSRRTLADETFQQYAADLLDKSAVPAEKLCFEITENGAISNMAKTIAFIKTLSVRGCRFSLDDFGAGMTSFSYLKALPVDFIKIDGSFIQMMSSSQIDYEMVRFTNDISHLMGRQTVAEYVTDESLLNKLQEIGVDFAQGYWIGRPQPLMA